VSKAKPSWAGLAVYLLVAFGLAWAIELGPVRAIGLQPGNIAVALWLIAVMFTPGLGALAARLVEGRGFGDAGLRWGRGRYHLAAWLLPFALGLVALGLTLALGAGHLDLSGTVILEKLPPEQRAKALEQVAAVGRWFPLIVILSGLTEGVLLTCIATFGEEFGWRGYLQVRLQHLGSLRAMVIVGLIWGLWHAPVIIQGHNYPGHPYLGVPLMCLFCVLLAIILGWLFEQSGSILAPTIAHASVNSPTSSLGAFVAGADPAIANFPGLIGIGVMAVFVLWLIKTGRVGGWRPPLDDESGDILQPPGECGGQTPCRD